MFNSVSLFFSCYFPRIISTWLCFATRDDRGFALLKSFFIKRSESSLSSLWPQEIRFTSGCCSGICCNLESGLWSPHSSLIGMEGSRTTWNKGWCPDWMCQSFHRNLSSRTPQELWSLEFPRIFHREVDQLIDLCKHRIQNRWFWPCELLICLSTTWP